MGMAGNLLLVVPQSETHIGFQVGAEWVLSWTEG